MTPFRKGRTTIHTPLERYLTDGLDSELIFISKMKAHGGDIGSCPRKTVLHCWLPKDFAINGSPSSSLYMAIGSAMHKVAADAFRRTGILRAEELRVELDEIGPPKFLPLSGYLDMVVEIEEEPAIIDIKTCGKLPAAPKAWHVSQVIVYAIASGIRKGYLHYISRNVADYRGAIIQKAFPVPMSDAHISEVAMRIATAHVFMQNQTLPPIPSHMFSKQDCGFCPFQANCWEGLPMPSPLAIPTEMQFGLLMKDAKRLSKQLVDTMHDRLVETLPRIATTA
jgi:CRISPR/Cas system-associated exonuclease Cas4 (RecB family)